MKYRVFIHTNHKQHIGALVAKYSIERNSRHNDRFDVQFIHTKDHSFLHAREGQYYLRAGQRRLWLNDDLQSFTPLRFMPPELMGYEGRAVVMDPDIFAVGDIWELLSRDMQGSAIMCRTRAGRKGRSGALASSVMLLDCAKLKSWNCAQQFNEMFEFKRDYMPWIGLKLEQRDNISLFENYWNDFDQLNDQTKLLHNTKRKTQPWKTGLPVDYRPAENEAKWSPLLWVKKARRAFFGEYGLLGHYKPHPDPAQEAFFFGLLKECLERGIVTEAMLQTEMSQNNVRHDAFQVLERTQPLAA
ncbi:MAG: hypothetical protein K0U68_13420 [Gammaproteobacteria bacterium]|nr:hypothetical protein [Gammaproteobacteria bacterium]